MADYTIDKINYGSNRYILKDSNALRLTSEGNLKIAGTFAAEEGIFNKLIATNATIANLNVDDLTAQNATVVGLLDVQGEMHTNNWTNANIANIGGSFYISPTLASAATSVKITLASNNYTIVVSGGNFVTSSSGITWSTGSKVMVTGSVTKNNVTYPLGTCTGNLSAISPTGFTVNQIGQTSTNSAIPGDSTVNGGLAAIVAEFGSGTTFTSSEIKISMYEIGPSGSYKPVGILLTSYGLNKETYIDIYGGVNTKNTDTTDNIPDGFADPNVRIGYLGGLPAYTDSNHVSHQPTGWGIYTDNGYFKGTIVADSGTVGGFSLNADELYYDGNIPGNSNNTFVIYPFGVGSNTNMFINQTTSEGGSAIDIQWALSIGKNFGVDTSGTLYANEANIAGTIIVGGETVATAPFVEDKIEDLSETFKDNLQDAIDDVNENIEVISSSLNDFIGDVNNLISIKDVDTISSNILPETVIGQIDTYSIGAGNNRISFNTSNYQEFAYLTNEKLYLNQIELTDRISIANSLTIANFQWINRSGRLTLMKI